MMTGMRWRIGYSLGWLAATCLAVVLSWIGVRSVLQASVFGTPVVVSVTPGASITPAAPGPSATVSVRPSGSPRASATASAAPSASPSAPATTASDVHSYSTAGGTAVLQVTATSVRFVSAAASAGYTAEESYGTDWLRVDFLTGNGAHGWSVVASWYLHAPTIQTVHF
jgi:hypothetical protein